MIFRKKDNGIPETPESEKELNIEETAQQAESEASAEAAANENPGSGSVAEKTAHEKPESSSVTVNAAQTDSSLLAGEADISPEDDLEFGKAFVAWAEEVLREKGYQVPDDIDAPLIPLQEETAGSAEPEEQKAASDSAEPEGVDAAGGSNADSATAPEVVNAETGIQGTAAQEPAVVKVKKKKKVSKLFIFLMVLLIAALGLVSYETYKMTDTESRFARAVRHGVTSGWALKNNEVQLKEKKATHNASFIDLEYDAVDGFKEMKFRSAKLGNLAAKYINALEECRKVAKKYNPNKDYDKFWANFSGPYGQRIEALYDLYNGNYGIELDDEEFKEERDNLLLQGWCLKKADKIEFKRVSGSGETADEDSGTGEGADSESSSTGENTDENAESGEQEETPMTAFAATVTNDSGFDLEYIDLEVQLYDNDGNLIETTSAYAENIKNGKDFELKCYQTSETEAASFLISSVQCAKKDKTSAKAGKSSGKSSKADADNADKTDESGSADSDKTDAEDDSGSSDAES